MLEKTDEDRKGFKEVGFPGGEKKKKDLSNELQKEGEEEEGEQNCLDLSSSQIVYVFVVSWCCWSSIELLYRPPAPINIILSLIKLV